MDTQHCSQDPRPCGGGGGGGRGVGAVNTAINLPWNREEGRSEAGSCVRNAAKLLLLNNPAV